MSNWEVEVNLRGVCRGVRARWAEGLGVLAMRSGAGWVVGRCFGFVSGLSG